MINLDIRFDFLGGRNEWNNTCYADAYFIKIKGDWKKKAIKYFREFRNTINSLESFSVLINNGWERASIEQAFLEANRIMKECIINSIQIIVIDSDEYPECFYRLDDYPALIYCKGNIELLRCKKNVAVIGTRDPELESEEIGRNLIELLCKKNIQL